MITKRLTARGVATVTKEGRHADGGNLYLTVSKTSGGLSRRWTFLYTFGRKKREAGFGSAAGVGAVSLADARARAGEYRALLVKKIDPLEAKKAVTEAATAVAARKSFGQSATAFYDSMKSGWKSDNLRLQWLACMTAHCKPIWDSPVESIGTDAVLSVLEILNEKPATASRVRGRVEQILDYAKVKGWRSGENPARWRGHLALISAKRPAKINHPAMAYDGVPAFVAGLRDNPAIAATAMEFMILTACRSGEVLGARWDEIDLGAKVWTIPASRMKAGQQHRTPLSARAMVILEKQAEVRCSAFVFPGMRPGKQLGHGALRRMAPEKATAHGFRSSFRDWAGNETSYPREVAEAALAHASGDATERAYRRGDALEKRRELMAAWANFCEPGAASGNVVNMKRA